MAHFFYGDAEVFHLSCLADQAVLAQQQNLELPELIYNIAPEIERNGKVFLVSKVLTRSDLDDNLSRVLLPKKLVLDNVSNFLTMKDWEDVNKREEGIEVRTWVGDREEENRIHFKYWDKSLKSYIFYKHWIKLAKKHGLNIGDKLNVWGRRDAYTNELQFEFTFDKQ
ncbi:hypothetical protein AMTRI_Chr05g68780 [Amborella trichopoda]|uniref:TF-B3 domain-containing protein n=1 Tax=Amborella trichopoda TaxID=13333 RepID=U5D500_AMBTC|nr:hypothetical protein AMTR_s00036p00218060 [Amborella trichopoda]